MLYFIQKFPVGGQEPVELMDECMFYILTAGSKCKMQDIFQKSSSMV